MPTPQEIDAERQQIYESAPLRDDLNDPEAEVLLQWGERQVERMANLFPNEFEQKCRFMRQLIKNINRFVGQREFNELDGQKEYMSKVIMYLPQLGFQGITEEMLFANLPAEKTDMMGTLRAVLQTLTPNITTPDGSGTLTAGVTDEEVSPPPPAPIPTPVASPIQDMPSDTIAPPVMDNPEPTDALASSVLGILNDLSANFKQTIETTEEHSSNDEKE